MPATVVITAVPAGTLRIRLFPLSAMYRFPAPSIATPSGEFRPALVAAPPSPPYPVAPVPATVVITAVPAATLRIRLFPVSAMYRFPEASNTAPCGLRSPPLVASPPSFTPPPATVLIIGDAVIVKL